MSTPTDRPPMTWAEARRILRAARAAERDAVVARCNVEAYDVARRRPVVRGDAPPRTGRALGEGRLVLRGERHRPADAWPTDAPRRA